MKLNDFFCDDLFSAFINHLRQCDHCRNGTRNLLEGLPMLSMLMPGESKKALLTALDQIEKGTPV